MERASIWQRFVGIVADGLVFSFISTLMYYAVGPQVSSALWVNIVFLIFTFFYFVGLTYKYKGKTLGKVLMRTKVVSEKGTLTLKQIVIRYGILYGAFLVVPLIVAIVFGNSASNIISTITLIGFIILMIRDPQNRGPHDITAKTKVVRTN